MLTTPFYDPSFIHSVSKAAELEKPYVFNGPTSIWINGESTSGKLKTVILEASLCTQESLKFSGALIENGKATYLSLKWESLTSISTNQTAHQLKLLTELLLKKQGLPISKCITGDHIGPAIWHSKGLTPMS